MGEESLAPIPLSPPNQQEEEEEEEEKRSDLNKNEEDINKTVLSDILKITEEEEGSDCPSNSDSDSVIHPSSLLPQPEPPHSLFFTKSESQSSSSSDPDDDHPQTLGRSASASVPAAVSSSITRFLRDRSSSLSSAITKRISSLTSDQEPDPVTEFHLSGLKVIVNLKQDHDDNNNINNSSIKGRISFFSRSGCRDCTAVRTFFREKALPFVEINVDVYPEREKELVERAQSSAVPQIFFNEKLVGGLVVLNSLRNSGEFDRRLNEIVGIKCPDSAPRAPVYGFDDEEEMRRRKTDAMVGIVRVLRQRLPIQDRLMKMKIVKNCFAGSEMVEAIILHLDCGRKKAVEIGRELARRHFIHHVFRGNDFEDGHNQFYRFLEHDPAIPKYFNFRGATNDDEPKSASAVGQRLTKLMLAILEAFASDDRHHLDYAQIAASEEFRRFVNLVQDLQRVDIFTLSLDETMAFFLNLYNAMVIHAVIRVGKPGIIDRRAFFSDFQYLVGGYPYSLSTIKNGILRSNRRQPYSFIRPFNTGDKRLEVALPKVNPLIHFGLCNGVRSSPTVRFFSAQGVELELRYAAREFFLKGGIEIDLSKRTVYLTRIMKWYDADFGQDKEILKWILNYLDATKSGLLTHLLNDGGPISIAYQNFDWSLNS